MTMEKIYLINAFLGGITLTTFLASSYIFAKFWKETRDRLLGSFSISFLLIAIERILLFSTHATDDGRSYLYVIRLVAFLLILYGIVQTNLSRR